MKRYIDSFLEYMVIIRSASQNTVLAYERDLARFAEHMLEAGAEKPDAVTESMLADYVFALEKGGAAPSTVARHVSSLRAFYRFLLENDDVQRNITDCLELPRRKREYPTVLTMEQIDRLLDAPDTERPMGQRDKAMLELLYASGLKVGELIRLYPGDIDLRSAIVRIASDNSSHSREIPFGEKARDALTVWIGKGRERYVSALKQAPLFVNVRGTGLTRQSVWKLVRQYAAQAGIEGEITPGILRHSFASHLMENGADAASLTRMMGFSAEAQTAVYESNEEERLRDIYAKAQKRG